MKLSCFGESVWQNSFTNYLRERNEGEVAISYFFLASSKLISTHEAVLKISVWQKKKQLTTTAYEAVVSCTSP
jgi:hypothetical protein